MLLLSPWMVFSYAHGAWLVQGRQLATACKGSAVNPAALSQASPQQACLSWAACCCGRAKWRSMPMHWWVHTKVGGIYHMQELEML